VTAVLTPITIRPCTSFQELDDCVDIQEQVWGYDERDIIPRRLFVVAQRIGGQIFGAFTQTEDNRDKLIAFAMALPGVRSQSPYLHSHMLAVLPPWRNAGIGRRLKLAQRDDALARGFRLMEWTFDPLEIKNAFLNIHRLGAIVRSYTPDFYGPLHSGLQAGLQSDRLHAEWWLDSPHVERTLSGQSTLTTDAVVETIAVTHEVAAWKASPVGRHHAASLQAANRAKLQSAFAKGLVVADFSRDSQGNGFYQLTKLANVDFQSNPVASHASAS
jgi:predicted GNAT superfamily acetyltransferase